MIVNGENVHLPLSDAPPFGKGDIVMMPLDVITISAVQATMLSAIGKHGIDRTPLNPDMTDYEKLVILTEEIGECARAMTYDEGNRDSLLKELLQTAAMALAWAQSIDTGGVGLYKQYQRHNHPAGRKR